MQKNIFMSVLLILLFFTTTFSFLIHKGVIVDYIIFRESPLGSTFIRDGNGNKIECADVVNMYNKWKENNADVDQHFRQIFENVIDINNSGYHGYYHKSQKPDRDIIVFFHGVQCCIFSDPFVNTSKSYCFLNYIKDDFDVLIVEYPSFSINKKENIRTNFKTVLNEVNKWVEANYKNKKKIIIGHSFGCYLSLYCSNLADSFIYDGIIILNPFMNIQSAAKHCTRNSPVYPFSFLVKKEYDCIEEISKIKTNVVIIKLDKDRICPPEDAKILFDNFNNNNQNFKCELVDMAGKDSLSNKYYRHEFPNIEQALFFAKRFCDKDYANITYDGYKKELIKDREKNRDTL